MYQNEAFPKWTCSEIWKKIWERLERESLTYIQIRINNILWCLYILLACELVTQKHHTLKFEYKDEEKEKNLQRELQSLQLWWLDILINQCDFWNNYISCSFWTVQHYKWILMEMEVFNRWEMGSKQLFGKDRMQVFIKKKINSHIQLS